MNGRVLRIAIGIIFLAFLMSMFFPIGCHKQPEQRNNSQLREKQAELERLKNIATAQRQAESQRKLAAMQNQIANLQRQLAQKQVVRGPALSAPAPFIHKATRVNQPRPAIEIRDSIEDLKKTIRARGVQLALEINNSRMDTNARQKILRRAGIARLQDELNGLNARMARLLVEFQTAR